MNRSQPLKKLLAEMGERREYIAILESELGYGAGQGEVA